eukprot:TRINITY_DN600_c3_g2_i1.p1 TRINITY_DN600_c3_g2~~TRINITY_DN600_c3_g2_i1.p1  ORF type:complete len:510 (+),score=89.58 TRINITY_DN600_c3_g2_i1:178-1707(+)
MVLNHQQLIIVCVVGLSAFIGWKSFSTSQHSSNVDRKIEGLAKELEALRKTHGFKEASGNKTVSTGLADVKAKLEAGLQTSSDEFASLKKKQDSLIEEVATEKAQVASLIESKKKLEDELEKLKEGPGLGYIPINCWTVGSYMTREDMYRTFRHSERQRMFYLDGLTTDNIPVSTLNGDDKADESRKFCAQYLKVGFVPKVTLHNGGPLLTSCPLAKLAEGVKTGSYEEPTIGEITFEVAGCDIPLKNFTRNNILTALKGRRIIIIGDSMGRQQFIRMVELIRNDRPLSEHLTDRPEHCFHFDVLYSANAENDSFHFFPEHEKIDSVPPGTGVPDPLVEILFLWDPFPLGFRDSLFTTLNPTDVISAFIYWWRPEDEHTKGDRFLQASVDWLKRMDVERPDFKPRVFHETIPMPALVPKWVELGERNQHLRDKVKEHNHPRLQIMDYAIFSDLREFPRQPDFVHFGCIFRPWMPDVINYTTSDFGSHGCQDPVTRNWARVLIAALSAPL